MDWAMKYVALPIAVALIVGCSVIAAWLPFREAARSDRREQCAESCEAFAPIIRSGRCYCDTTKPTPRATPEATPTEEGVA